MQDGHSAQQVQDRLLGHHGAGRHQHQAQERAVSPKHAILIPDGVQGKGVQEHILYCGDVCVKFSMSL